MPDFMPRRRLRGLRIEEFQGEVLVYDLDHHRAHCLNGIAARVWHLCDGTRTVSEIAGQIADTHEASDEDLVWRALTELESAGLLSAPAEGLPIEPGRRKALAQLGWVAGIPLVLSIAVPTPASAQSIVTVVTTIGG